MGTARGNSAAAICAVICACLLSCNGSNQAVPKTSSLKDMVDSATKAVKSYDYFMASALLFDISLDTDCDSVKVPDEMKKYTGGQDLGFARTALAYAISAMQSATPDDRKRILPYVLSEIELLKSRLVGPSTEIENIRLLLELFYPLVETHVAFRYRAAKDDRSFERSLSAVNSAQNALHDCGVHSETFCAALGELSEGLQTRDTEKQAVAILELLPNDLTNIEKLKSAVVEKNAEASRMSTAGGDLKSAIRNLLQSATISLLGWLMSGDAQLAQYFSIAISEMQRIS